jgi:hypothetical protein
MAERAEIAVDQPREARAQGRGAEARSCRRARAQIVQEHVGAADQRDQALAFVSVLDVDADRALVAVHLVKHRRVVAPDRRAPVPRVVAAVGLLHFDDVGAQVGEDFSRERRGEGLADFDHANTGEHHGESFVAGLV